MGRKGYVGPIERTILCDMGKRIDEMCYKRNISYKQLSEEAGIVQETIYRIFDGYGCNVDTAVKIASVLGCSLDYLILGKTIQNGNS